MTTVTLWVLFQVFPFVQPITATKTVYECMALAQKIEDSKKEGDEVLMKCGKVEVLVEYI